MRIAYLACADTLPGSPTRRADAFEHDQMIANLRLAFEAAGSSISEVAWDDAGADWASFDAALIGTTWDYQDRIGEFMPAIEAIAAHIPLFNAPDTIRWNARKTYLRELEQRGAPVVPTLWFDQVGQVEIDHAFAAFSGSDRLVCKRQVGANAEGQHLLQRGETPPAMSEPMMVQPFLPSVADEGEYAFIFVNGELSHALVKRAASGDYRVQSGYGGTNHAIDPDPADVRLARDIVALVDPLPLYARVDMVRGPNGGLLLMELELIEPFLYVEEGPGFGAMLHRALVARLNAAASE